MEPNREDLVDLDKTKIMAKEASDKEFVQFIVENLVNHPDEVGITRSVDEMGVLISVSVHADDMGIIIGKDGRNARALRTLARIVGAKNDARVNLRIEEPEDGERSSSSSDSSDSEDEEEADDVDDAVEDLDL